MIDAAAAAGVQLFAYTSVLRADTSTLLVSPDHIATERHLAASGLRRAILRNGWYHENRTASLASAIEAGAIVGCAGDGRIAAAARADYAEAAAVVLTTPGHVDKVYEFGGDSAFSLGDLAAEVSEQSGRKVVYNNMSERDFQSLLEGIGLPKQLANLVADSDTKAARGELDTTSGDLRDLIGRPTTTLASAVAAALRRP